MLKVGDVLEGKYEVQAEVGRGGMSVVYQARDTHLNRLWAIKEVRKTGKSKQNELYINSMMAEANLMKRLDHPALPRIVDIIDTGETICVVMDFVEGESLDKILNEYGAQPEEMVIEWAKQVCDALSYLHRQKPPIIYRDMKPANIMLKPEGNIKIIDFGIAREYKELSLADTTVLGTRGYAPPEQYNGQTDPRSDIFALGMTMHHLLTGVDPRAGEAYAPVRHYNPKLSEGIEFIINKCTEPARENRYQSCAELMYDLENPSQVTRGHKRKQRIKLGLFIGAFALSIAALISGVSFNAAAEKNRQGDYSLLLSSRNIDEYYSAADIFPGNVEAYNKILDYYSDAGKFTEEESRRFDAIYGAATFDESDPETAQEVAELRYRAGLLYMSFYTRADGSSNISDRNNKAYDYFLTNHENAANVSYEHKALSECYYEICNFNKRFKTSSASMEEAGKQDYEDLLKTLESIKPTLESSSQNNEYNRLTFYNAVFELLFDQRAGLATKGVSRSEVLDLFDECYTSAKALNVQKPASMLMQKEITDHYEQYREMIETVYSNKGGA